MNAKYEKKEKKLIVAIQGLWRKIFQIVLGAFSTFGKHIIIMAFHINKFLIFNFGQ